MKRIQGKSFLAVVCFPVVLLILVGTSVRSVWNRPESKALSDPIPGKATTLLSEEEFRRRLTEFELQNRLGVVQGTLFAGDQFGSGFVGSSSSDASAASAKIEQGNRTSRLRLAEGIFCNVTIHPCDGTCRVYGGQLLFQTPAGDLEICVRHVGTSSSDFYVVSEEQLAVIETLDQAIPLMTVVRADFLDDQACAYLDGNMQTAERFARAVYSQYRHGFNRTVVKPSST